MALASVDAALTQYDTYAVWEGSPAYAALFLEAVRYLLAHRPSATSINSRNISYTDLRDQEKSASAYLLKMGSTANAARASFVRGRPV